MGHGSCMNNFTAKIATHMAVQSHTGYCNDLDLRSYDHTLRAENCMVTRGHAKHRPANALPVHA